MKSVRELLTEYPLDEDNEIHRRYAAKLDEYVAMATELHEQIDPIAYLDHLLDSDHSRAYAIKCALLSLPPDVVLANFGEEVTIWLSANAIIGGEREAVNSVLEAQAGYNITDLETSRLWGVNKYSSSQGKSISATYGLMQRVKTGALDDIDLEKLLSANTRPDVSLSAKRLADYALMPLELLRYNVFSPGGRVKDWCGDVTETEHYDMWLDAPTGYALTYKGIPNAMAGVAMRNPEELMVYQIQGVRGNKIDPTIPKYSDDRVIGKIPSRGLAPLDWQAVMVGTAESLAHELDVPQVGIQTGKNNIWIKPQGPNVEAHITLETAERVYDATARRLGYSQDPADRYGDWHKTLES